jgi:two-component system chemotaxis response regulator CheB
MMRRIRVLIVDDSALVRRAVREALATDPAIEVVGAAADAYAARDLILTARPDILTLDLEMPGMDGLTFLRALMEQRPTPVIVLSSLTPRGSIAALEAMRLGALDVVAKPSGPHGFAELAPQLIARIKAGRHARVTGRPAPAPAVMPRCVTPPGATHHARSLILLGASTGGIEALREVLTRLPATLPAIAIVQHIPALFSKAFADRLNSICALDVHEAVDGEALRPGHEVIAPGDSHLVVTWDGRDHRAHVRNGPAVWHQRPAIDVLFQSAADCGAAPHSVAGVFTGMGRDGAQGLLQLRNRGATTFAQDEATSVVYGMPRAAWEQGAAERQLPLQQIAPYLTEHYGTRAAFPVTCPVSVLS